MPAQLFYTTGIPVCLWFLTRDKSGTNPTRKRGNWRDRQGETLFIDARKLGTMQTRTLRVLTDGDFTNPTRERGPAVSEDAAAPLADASGCCADLPPASDIGRIVYAFRQLRGEPAPTWWNEKEHGEWSYRDIPGFCKAADLAEIEKHGFVLTPGRYVGAEEQEDDGEPFADKFPRLVAELEEHFADGERLAALVRERLAEVADNA